MIAVRVSFTHLRRGGCCRQVGSSDAGSAMPWKHRLSKGCCGCPLPQQELRQLHSRAQGLSFPVRQSHPCSEHFPAVISTGDLFHSKCWDLYILQADLLCHLFPLLCLSRWMLLGRRAAVSSGGPRGGPAGDALLSSCQVMPLGSFPPSWMTQGYKEWMGTTLLCICSRCCHCAPGTWSSIALTLLPGVGWCRSPEWSVSCAHSGARPTVCGSDACLQNYFSRFLS